MELITEGYPRQHRTVNVAVEPGPGPGTHTIAFRSQALAGTLAACAGALSTEQLGIVSAVVRLGADGMVTDLFDVVPLRGKPLAFSDGDRLAAVADAILNGRREIAAELLELRRAYPTKMGIVPRVDIRTDSSLTTGINVVCADRPGLLYDIASTLSKYALRTRSLGVLTFDDKAHDTFRVVDADGRPPVPGGVLDALRDELLNVCA